MTSQEMIVYPCTITHDRYGGCYSGAEWLAWPLDVGYDVFPADAQGDDFAAAVFWDEFDGLVGKGATPDDAYDDLLRRSILAKGTNPEHRHLG